MPWPQLNNLLNSKKPPKGFYIDNDIETIQLIEEILNDKNLKNKLVENSLKTIERNYLIDKIVNEEFEIYKILTTDK